MTKRSIRISQSAGGTAQGKPTFGAVLQEYRMKNGVSQKDLARALSTTAVTVGNWETDKSRPDIDAIRRLCAMFRIPVADLFGLPTNVDYAEREDDLVRQYRKLSAVNRWTVRRVVSSLLQEQQDAHERDLEENFFVLRHYDTPAAAGPGTPFGDEETPEYRFVRRNGFNGKADAIIRVSGSSMEPYYHDGDSVYIQYAESARDGDDVVCSTADGAVIKRYRGGRLYSLNDALPFGEKYEDDNVRILARVLAVVAEDDLAAKEDIPLLEELLADEVKAFEQAHGGAQAY